MDILLQFLHMVKQAVVRPTRWLAFKTSLASKYFSLMTPMVLYQELLKIYGTFILI